MKVREGTQNNLDYRDDGTKGWGNKDHVINYFGTQLHTMNQAFLVFLGLCRSSLTLHLDGELQKTSEHV